jgi:hypothetical protein
MEKFYDTVGTSIMPGGVKKVRFANGCAARTKHLKKVSKHTEVLLHQLPRPMSKDDATMWLVVNYPDQVRGIDGIVIPEGVSDPNQMELNFDESEQQQEQPEQPADRMAAFDAEMAAMGDVYGDGEVSEAEPEEDEIPEDIDPELLAEIERREAEPEEDEIPEDIGPELLAEIERREAEEAAE